VRRGVTLGLVGMAVAAGVTWPAQASMHASPLGFALPALLVLVAAGVAGDMIGVAAAAADEAALHAMASRRLPGARAALRLKRDAARVTSIAGDIVGDIAGTVSGAAAAAIAGRLALTGSGAHVAEALAVAVVAGLTVGGKAAVKGIALERANAILYGIGHLVSVCTGWARESRRRASR
jgi:hypothetical protein